MASLLSVLSLALVVAVTVLAPEGASAVMVKMSEESAFFKHYAKFKILSHCFGDGVVMGWNMNAEKLLMECREEARQQRALAKETRRLDGTNRGEKEEETKFYSADRVRIFKNKMMNKITFLNCTMDKMNITTTPEGNVDTVALMDYYKTLNLEAALESDVLEGIKKCGVAASCGEFLTYGPVDANFQKKTKFVKCEQEARLTACVRKDLRLLRDQFDFAGLDGLLDDVADDEDKMFAIMSVKASMDQSHKYI